MNRTILVIDDNAVTRGFVRETLEGQGYQIVEARDGESALAALDTQRPDLVLQDLVLPDVDGFDLAVAIRARLQSPHVPLLAFSGFVSTLDEARLASVGFDDLVMKPVATARLIKVVHTYLPVAVAPAERFGAGRLLLIADPDSAQARLDAYRWELFGFRVATARDGREALDHARTTPPAAIISEIMMPRVDGFGLCMAARRDAALRDVPILLVAWSDMEDADRELARGAGANACVRREPDFRRLVDTLRAALEPRGGGEPPAEVDHGTLEAAHCQRVVSQLERQVSLNAGIAQRCALLASELSILSGISGALSGGTDFDAALDAVLASFFDAAGISTGALLLFEDDAVVSRSVGFAPRWEAELKSFFGDLPELRALLEAGSPLLLPLESGLLSRAQRALNSTGARSALVLPILHRRQCFGALLIASNGASVTSDDRVAFAVGVAAQIAQGLALARAFEAKVKAEREAREQASLLEAIMASLSDGVAVTDSEGRFLFWNAAADTTIRPGAAEAGLDGWSARYDVFLPDKTTRVPMEALPLARALRGETIERQELYVVHDHAPDGAWLSVTARPLRVGAQGRGAVTVFRDVSVEKATAEQLMIADRMVSVGTLASGVAHEINNPLASVMANVHLAALDADSFAKIVGPSPELDQLRDELHDAAESAERIRNIVRDLKIFSRSEEEKTGPVDVQRVLESTLRMAYNEIRHRARLVKVYGKVAPVEASESRLGQAFLNLIVNAAQAIAEGRTESNEIRISTSTRADGHVVVEIADTGPGMPPEILARVFTPFFTTKPAGVGTGLGLSISRQIVTGFGGSIDVRSEVGVGTTIRMALPPSVSVGAPGTQSHATAAARRRGKILVVDDDPMIAKAVERTLSAEHDVTTMGGGARALDRIRAGERFDVIFCDLMMPDVTGMEFHAGLVQIDRDQAERIIFVTGGAFTPRARAFLREVANLRIEKPFDLMQLRALVHDRVR
ncbi:MAG: response regulator [Myxococcota bacterium]